PTQDLDEDHSVMAIALSLEDRLDVAAALFRQLADQREDLRMRDHQLLEAVPREPQEDGIGLCADGRGGRLPGEERHLPEDLPLLEERHLSLLRGNLHAAVEHA